MSILLNLTVHVHVRKVCLANMVSTAQYNMLVSLPNSGSAIHALNQRDTQTVVDCMQGKH